MDAKKAHPPPECAPHREVISKLHALVVFINSHRNVLTEFLRLDKEKNKRDGERKWQSSPLDNDTRWDSALTMLEHGVFFDEVLHDLAGIDDLEISQELIFNREELDLAIGMTWVLSPVREFTKFA